jgi:hypothetical protein
MYRYRTGTVCLQNYDNMGLRAFLLIKKVAPEKRGDIGIELEQCIRDRQRFTGLLYVHDGLIEREAFINKPHLTH